MSIAELEVRAPRTFADQVAANIRAEAAWRGVTQRALARALGLAQPTVSDRWRGKTPWTLNEVEAVAHLLGTTTSTLCAIRDSNPEPTDLEVGHVIDLAEWRSQRTEWRTA